MRFIKKVNLDKDLRSKGIPADIEKKVYAWHQTVTQKDLVWNSFEDVRKTYDDADRVEGLYVFNMKGYRLIAGINFNRQAIYYKEIMSHKEYDKNTWKEKYSRSKR